MLRDVRVSPDGKLVVYSALGHLYTRTLPSGEPKRLTAPASGGKDTYEFFPTFSRDGQWIVYTTWNDTEFGRVRVIRPDGSGGRDVVAQPGHYVQPSFSPDGKLVVFRHAGGDSIRGPYYAGDAGIYVVPAAGGTPLLARESGSDPEFDHTGARIYVREVRNEKYTLLSVGVPTAASPLPGRDEIEHVRSDNATQIVPSPDGRWVAFEERFRTYVAAFPRTGRPVDVGPAAQTYPVQRVSRDAGFYLHWSGDSRRLHWALGPELFTRELASSFAFVAGGQAKAAEPEAKGIPIGFTVKSDQPQGVVALVGARVITMANLAAGPIQGTPGVIENATVVVEGNRISAIGPSSSVTVPAARRGSTSRARRSCRGSSTCTGISAANRAGSSGRRAGRWRRTWRLASRRPTTRRTTARRCSPTPSSCGRAPRSDRACIRPARFSTAPRRHSRRWSRTTRTRCRTSGGRRHSGAISVKSYNQQRRDARQMIVKASRELEILDVPEGGSLLYMNQTHVLDGHTGVEHSLPVPRLYKDTVELFAKSSVGYTPTLIVGYGGLSGEFYWYQHTNVWENERLLTFMPREVIDARSRRRVMAPETDFNHVLIARGAKQIADAGGSVQLGAHGQLQGLGAHWELWMLQQGGMTPMESLRAATIAGARYLGLDGDIGSLEKGKLADLIVLDRNPLENIRNSESIGMVMMNGRLYDGKTLAEVGATKRPAPKFWWN